MRGADWSLWRHYHHTHHHWHPRIQLIPFTFITTWSWSSFSFLYSLFNLVQPCWPATFQHWQTHWAYPTTGGYQSCSILSCRITCLQFGKSLALQAWITTGRSSIGLPRSHHHRREPCSSSINEAFPPSFEQQKLKINNKHQQTASFGLKNGLLV